MKKLSLAVLSVIIFTSSAFGLSLSDLISSSSSSSQEPEYVSLVNPEEALSARSSDAVYFVLKLENMPRLLKWVMSKENIDILMPLILSSKEANEIIGGIEMASAIVGNTPIRSVALVIGMNKRDIKRGIPFFQMAFTVDKSASSIVKRMASGEASAVDIAKLLLGVNSPLASFAESMIKVEDAGENILQIDNEIFMKAEDELIMLGTSLGEVQASISAYSDKKGRMFEKISRKFDKKDFAFMHIDPKTVAMIDDDDLKAMKLDEYFDKPLEIEFGFERLKDKFSVSTGVNILKSLKKKYAEKFTANKFKPVKGGNIDLENAGGSQSPLMALGTYFEFSTLKDSTELKSMVRGFTRQMKNRFGITEDELTNLLNGPVSIVVNGNVEVEGFKVPAIYFSQTGRKGAAAKVYDKLAKSPHFQDVQNGILQVNSSVSPVSCLVNNREDTLDISFAELASLSDKPSLTPALDELVHKSAIAAFWLNFVSIQNWLNDDENGVFAMAAPVARVMGYGKYIDALRDVLSAELSVPSISLWSENAEVFYTDFALKEINPDNGLLSKLVKIYRDFSQE